MLFEIINKSFLQPRKHSRAPNKISTKIYPLETNAFTKINFVTSRHSSIIKDIAPPTSQIEIF